MSEQQRRVRLFLDANILFAAAYSPQGTAAFVIANAGPQRELLTSEYAHREALRNLHRKSPAAVERLHLLMRDVRMVVGDDELMLDIPLREKDRPILAAAIRVQADYLLTGDRRDFGPWFARPEVTGGVCILTLAAYRDLGA